MGFVHLLTSSKTGSIRKGQPRTQLLASGPIAAQEDPPCTGFWENSITSGGTNGAAATFAADLDSDGRAVVDAGASAADVVSVRVVDSFGNAGVGDVL